MNKNLKSRSISKLPCENGDNSESASASGDGSENDIISYSDSDIDNQSTDYIKDPIAIGYEVFSIEGNLAEALEIAGEEKQSFVCLPLINPSTSASNCKTTESSSKKRKLNESNKSIDETSFINERDISHEDWASFIIGKISEQSLVIRNESLFLREYSYATHLGLQAVIVPLRSNELTSFARLLVLATRQFPATAPQIWISINWNEWEIWDRIRFLIDSNPKVFIALSFPADGATQVIESPGFLNENKRWFSEPVKAIFLSTSLFSVLPKGQQKNSPDSLFLSNKNLRIALHLLFQLKMHVIITGPMLTPRTHVRDYVDCMETLHRENTSTGDRATDTEEYAVTEQEEFNYPYRDSLRGPLDPLHDNLDSNTYRIMEQDPVKYERYEAALIAAVRDLKKKDNSPLRVLIVGPGRGPLIESALLARAVTKTQLEVIAVEKNPNAIITLRHRFAGRSVEIIHGDMRKVVGVHIAEKSVDIIISELLGSWGDNEASPECLIHVQPALKERGVMIPQFYRSYIAPISSSKLWSSARDMSLPTDSRHLGLDSPYVVCLHAHNVLSDPQPLFEFHHPEMPASHPSAADASEEVRLLSKTVRFAMTESSQSVTMHGFAGYFDCVLYKDISLSTVPATHSPGMFSWFPMFIPIKQPIRLGAKDIVEASVWRLTDSHKMWYEWTVSTPALTLPVQNSNGQSFSVQL